MIRTHTSRRGFTLIEMAIVLVVAGTLFGGLWRLLSGGNQQVRDQSAAQQQTQLISGVKSYLATSQGQSLLQAMTANATVQLPLPANAAACPALATTAPVASVSGFCNFLPSGFVSGTANSYGQNYLIQVLKDNNGAGTNANTYSFMIMTTLGDAIPDTSGGRIAAGIGNDGGFIYSTNVCNAANTTWACGSYGTWAIQATAVGPNGYGFAAGNVAVGHIASRTSVLQSGNFNPWLERLTVIQPDPQFTWNTMNSDLFMGGQSQSGTSPVVLAPNTGNIYMYPPIGGAITTGIVASGNIIMGPPVVAPGVTNGNIFMAPPTATTSGGNINMAGGTINFVATGLVAGGGVMNVQGGTINMSNVGSTTGGGIINLMGGSIIGNGTSNIVLTGSAGTVNPLIIATNAGVAGCPMTIPGSPAGCPYAISTDTINVSNIVNANFFYSPNFVYTASDIRLKTDIRPMTTALDDVMKLRPVSFTLKSSGKKEYGIIAQELEKVYPELVSQGDGMKSVSYDGLIGPLIGAVQELKRENDDLRNQLREYNQRQRDLEKRLSAH